MFELNKIYNLDCIEGMKEIPDNFIDLIVTDPPYLINYKTNRRKNKNHDFCTPIQNDNNPELIVEYIKECHRIMKENAAMYMFCNWKKVGFFKRELEKKFNLTKMIIWIKNNHTAGDLKCSFGNRNEYIYLVNKSGYPFDDDDTQDDLWFFDKVAGKALIHQNQKPQPLIEKCIMKHSKENDIVFDGFAGSGTTAFAAKKLGRQFLGFELEKNYCDEANKKLLKIYRMNHTNEIWGE